VPIRAASGPLEKAPEFLGTTQLRYLSGPLFEGVFDGVAEAKAGDTL
jgi:hypothetical protein